MGPSPMIDELLSGLPPLEHPRGARLPLLVWALTDLLPPAAGDADAALRGLGERGLALLASWSHEAPAGAPGSIDSALPLARRQRELGLEVCVNATSLLHRFCDGSAATAHIDSRGEPFFDTSFHPLVKMGCPFSLEHRESEIRARVESFADAYARAGVPPTLVFADWEIDGALEWNGAWDASRRCARCRAELGDIDDFAAFRRAIRRVRSRLQRVSFAEPLRQRFAEVLVANYGVHPHDGTRYWYDYFEYLPAGAPFIAEHGARYRSWEPEFAATGYTAAMPVLYPWSRIWDWYDFEPTDYRWVYNMLLEASGAGRSTPAAIPLIPFVHHATVFEDGRERPGVAPLGEEAYRELLWHVLLRGAATLFLWCPAGETPREILPVHEVYRESLRYAELLAHGRPVAFDVPSGPAPVVSAVRCGSQLLVRRTDFGQTAGEVQIEIDGPGRLRIPAPGAPGECLLLDVGSPGSCRAGPRSRPCAPAADPGITT